MRNRWRGLSTIKVIRLKEIVVFVQQQNGAGLWCTLTSTFIHYSRAHWGWTLDRIFVRQQEHNEALWWKKSRHFWSFFFFVSFYFGVCFCAAPGIMSCSGQGHKKNEMSKCFYFQWIGFLPFSLIFVAACQFFFLKKSS